MAETPFTGIGKVKTITRSRGTLDFLCTNGRVRVQGLSDSIVRVRATRAAEFGRDFSYAVAKRKWPNTQFRFTAGTITTKKLRITIRRSPFRIEVAAADGKMLSADDARGMGWEGTKCRSYRRLA